MVRYYGSVKMGDGIFEYINADYLMRVATDQQYYVYFHIITRNNAHLSRRCVVPV